MKILLSKEEMKQVTILRNIFKGRYVECFLNSSDKITSVIRVLKKQERVFQGSYWNQSHEPLRADINVFYFSSSDAVSLYMKAFYDNKEIGFNIEIDINDLRQVTKQTVLTDLKLTPLVKGVVIKLKDLGQTTLESI